MRTLKFFCRKLCPGTKLGSTIMIPRKNSVEIVSSQGGPLKAKSKHSKEKVITTVFQEAEKILLVGYFEDKEAVSADY